MENQIYYTFSTIPQVLGAAIALLGVFCIYKIEQINSRLKGIGNAILIEFERSDYNYQKVYNEDQFLISRLKKSIERSDQIKLKETIDKIVSILNTDSFKKEIKLEFERIEKQKLQLISQTKNAVLWSAITIILSVLILPFANLISTCISIGLFTIGLILFAFSVSITVKVVYNALKMD